MLKTVEVDDKEISSLDAVHLTELLRRLLYLEAESKGIFLSAVDVPLEIAVSDQGKDGSIKWEGGPRETDWFTNDTYFQVKATQMGPEDCKAELLSKDKKSVKPALKALFDRGGSYVLFCNKPGQDANRVKKMREALVIGGVANPGKADIRTYNIGKITEWTNRHIGAVSAVREWGHLFPPTFQSWEKLSRYAKHCRTEYFEEDSRSKHNQTLLEAARKVGTVLRITGASGVGKTRFLIEAFKNSHLKYQLAYFDTQLDPGPIAQSISSWMHRKSGTIVVDNCSLEVHRVLVGQIEHLDNRLSLITIDYNPHVSFGDHILVDLKPLTGTTISSIVKPQFSSLADGELKRIVEFAEGYPEMAVRLCDSTIKNEPSIKAIPDWDLANRLLVDPAEPDPEGQTVMNACSLFSHIYYDDKITDEIEFIADTICGIDAQVFVNRMKKYIGRGVMTVHGSYARVVPKPLAWRLASDWWEKCPRNLAAELVKKEKWPGSLTSALCDQLRYLADTQGGRRIAKVLCDPDHPFASAENLSSEKGSRIFRALAQVDPETALDCVESAFNEYSSDDLRKVEKGRRNLVWAFEDLCFWRNTFERAAALLLRFAAAENETFGNNATNQIGQLFHVALPGTQADLNQRLAVLDRALGQNNPEFESVLLKAMIEGLEFTSFHRTSGVEEQGGRRPEKDYAPKNTEVLEYWEELLERLKVFAYQTSECGAMARNEIGQFFLGMLRYRLLALLQKTVTDILYHRQDFWPEGLQALKFAAKHDGKSLPPKDKIVLDEVLASLEPKSLDDKFRLLVSEPAFTEYDTDDQGHITASPEINARTFGAECAKTWPDWESKLDQILIGEQRQAEAFGEGLVSNMLALDRKPFLDTLLVHLSQMPAESVNLSLLGGFLFGLKGMEDGRALITFTLDAVFKNNDLNKFYVWLLTKTGVGKHELDTALSLMHDGIFSPTEFQRLTYGGALKGTPADLVIELTSAIMEFQPSVPLCLTLLFMYSYQDENRWLAVSNQSRHLLMHKETLAAVVTDKGGDLYHWQQSVIRLLEQSPDVELARHVAADIASICGYRGEKWLVNRIDFSIKEVLKILLPAYYKESWEPLGNALVSEDYKVRSDAAFFLGDRLALDEKEGLMSLIPSDFLVNWAENLGDEAQEVLARNVPLLIDDETATVNPFALKLLDAFGDKASIVEKVIQSIWTASWVGSATPRYQRLIAVMEGLKNHKHRQVRRSAVRTLEGLASELERSKKRDAEEAAGIHDGWVR